MKKSSDDKLRQEIIGLGKNSVRKNYYGSLLKKQKALEIKNKELEDEIFKRKETEDELKQLNELLESRIQTRTNDLNISNQKLQESLDYLEKSYTYLIEAEKMASLNHLVKGISHELNTPLGVSLTTTTYVSTLLKTLIQDYDDTMSQKDVTKQLKKIDTSLDLVMKAIKKSTDLTNSFKEIASMHGHHHKGKFSVIEYINTIVRSMQSSINHFDDVEINVHCDKNFIVDGYPGIFTQVLTILFSNTFIHGFDQKGGTIDITFDEQEEFYHYIYKDNGKGLDEKLMQHVFEPFFTTKMSGQSPGLGLFTAYNLVKSVHGNINCYNDSGFCIEVQVKKVKTI